MRPSIIDTIYNNFICYVQQQQQQQQTSFDYILTLHIGLSDYLLCCLVSFKQDKADTSLGVKYNNWFHLAESETQEVKTDYPLGWDKPVHTCSFATADTASFIHKEWK